MLVTACRLLSSLVFIRRRSTPLTAPTVWASIRSTAFELLRPTTIPVGTITGPIRPTVEWLWIRFAVHAGAASKPELPVLKEHAPGRLPLVNSNQRPYASPSLKGGDSYFIFSARR